MKTEQMQIIQKLLEMSHFDFRLFNNGLQMVLCMGFFYLLYIKVHIHMCSMPHVRCT